MPTPPDAPAGPPAAPVRSEPPDRPDDDAGPSARSGHDGDESVPMVSSLRAAAGGFPRAPDAEVVGHLLLSDDSLRFATRVDPVIRLMRPPSTKTNRKGPRRWRSHKQFPRRREASEWSEGSGPFP